MNWWRAYHGLPNDSKLALIAKRANCRRCEVLAVWVSLLDMASQSEERGCIEVADPEEIGCALDMDTALVDSILAAFRAKEMLSRHETPRNASSNGVKRSSEFITAWDKRQVRRERDDDSSDRVKEHRKRKKLGHLSAVTPSNATVTPGNTQIRVEEIREEKKEHTAAVAAVIEIGAPRFSKTDVIQWFTEFWAAYPKKSDKPKAFKAFQKAATSPELAREIIDGAKRYAASMPDPEFTKYPQGWLSGERWNETYTTVLRRKPGCTVPVTVPPPATRAIEIEALQDLLHSNTEAEEDKQIYRERLAELGAGKVM